MCPLLWVSRPPPVMSRPSVKQRQQEVGEEGDEGEQEKKKKKTDKKEILIIQAPTVSRGEGVEWVTMPRRWKGRLPGDLGAITVPSDKNKVRYHTAERDHGSATSPSSHRTGHGTATETQVAALCLPGNRRFPSRGNGQSSHLVILYSFITPPILPFPLVRPCQKHINKCQHINRSSR